MRRQRFIILPIIFIFIFLIGCDGYGGPGTSDYVYSISGKYKLNHGGTSYINDSDGNLTIDRNITGIAWNEDFILAEQVKDNTSSFWIILVKENKVYGPLTKDDYERKKEELKVNAKLKLENPSKYRDLDKSNKKMSK